MSPETLYAAGPHRQARRARSSSWAPATPTGPIRFAAWPLRVGAREDRGGRRQDRGVSDRTHASPAWRIDDELKRKLLFTLLALVIYRIGAHIAAPGVNVTALADFIRNSAAAGFFGLYDALGGGLSRATVFALGIMPYISASIIFQLAGGVVAVDRQDAEGRGGQEEDHPVDPLPHRVHRAVAGLHLRAVHRVDSRARSPIPGFASRLIMVVTLTTGAIFVMWLGEQITERGIGNGMSLLITFSILERFWPGTLQLLQFIRSGVVTRARRRCSSLAILVGVIAAVVAHDHRRAADPDPDPAQGHGPGPDPRRRRRPSSRSG